MYEQHWQLDRMPFESQFDQSFYYPCDVHQGALLKVRYAIENRREGAVLAGVPGTGKTLLAHLLADQLGETFSPRVHLVFPQLPPNELMAWLAVELTDQEGKEAVSPHVAVRRIGSALQQNAMEGRHAVIFIDDAQDLVDTGALETIRLLLNFTAAGTPALTVVLLGQTLLLPALDRLHGLEEKMGVKCLLRPLTLEETVSYINHRLNAAGRSEPIFSDDAMETIYQLAGGVPRKINRLCDLALLIGFAEERNSINAEQIESVCDELVQVAMD